MGQQSSVNLPSRKHTTHSQMKQTRSYTPPSSIQHQSFLKVRRTPFKNSIKVFQSPPLYLQSYQIPFTTILSERMNGTKLFTQDDIIKLIQTCIYGLAHLQSNNIIYKDITSNNIYYNTEQGTFKLLPNQLINQSSYQVVLNQKQFRNLSPEMILSFRNNEEQLSEQVLSKSNIFMVGMLLLETCTLKSSSECYDDHNYDILHQEIENRLQMVKQFYPIKLYELLNHMLSYEYQQRMNSQQLSQYIYDQIAQQKLFNNKEKEQQSEYIHQNNYNEKQQPIIYHNRTYQDQTNYQNKRSVSKNKNIPLLNITRKNQYYRNTENIQKPKQKIDNPYMLYDNQRQQPQRNHKINHPYYPNNYNQQHYQTYQYNTQSNYAYNSNIYSYQNSYSPSKNYRTPSQSHLQNTNKYSSNLLKYQKHHNQNMYQRQSPLISNTSFNTNNNNTNKGKDQCDESINMIKQHIQKSRMRIQQFDYSKTQGRSYY